MPHKVHNPYQADDANTICLCYIPEFETLLLIFLLIYGYDFVLYHMITYLYSRS